VGINVVLRTAQPLILAYLYQAGGTGAFLVDDGGAAGDDGFLWDAIRVAGAALDLGSRLV